MKKAVEHGWRKKVALNAEERKRARKKLQRQAQVCLKYLMFNIISFSLCIVKIVVIPNFITENHRWHRMSLICFSVGNLYGIDVY